MHHRCGNPECLEDRAGRLGDVLGHAKWVNEGWSLRYIFNYALACHASYINNKSAPLPPGENVRAETERFLRRWAIGWC